MLVGLGGIVQVLILLELGYGLCGVLATKTLPCYRVISVAVHLTFMERWVLGVFFWFWAVWFWRFWGFCGWVCGSGFFVACVNRAYL